MFCEVLKVGPPKVTDRSTNTFDISILFCEICCNGTFKVYQNPVFPFSRDVGTFTFTLSLLSVSESWCGVLCLNGA